MFKMFNKKKQKFLFTIICATYGKLNNLDSLCKSLNNQNYGKFELLICDQNKNSTNKKFVKKYKNIKILFIKSKIGLSKARNKGINYARGNYLIFLDDDIYLQKNFLNQINNYLNSSDVEILTYRVINNKKKPLLNYPKKNCYLKSYNEIFNSISSVSFVIKNKYKIFFDEKLGLGSKNIYKSGEETDYILRSIKKYNCRIFYNKKIFVTHTERKIPPIDQIKKSFFYGCGWSYVVKKNKLGFYFTLNSILKIFFNIGYHIFTLNFKKFILSICTILGRIYGLIK